mmetsp:Transcript_6132/g.14219  ORF Transcript_6132/g.14219 Transcript_6132/m.14219 type:complete len:85 (+) Transcript_6132:200-454(+)
MALRLAHVYTCRDFNDAHAATYSAQCFTWTKEHSSTGMRGLLIFFLRPRTSGVPPGGISSSSSDSCSTSLRRERPSRPRFGLCR